MTLPRRSLPATNGGLLYVSPSRATMQKLISTQGFEPRFISLKQKNLQISVMAVQYTPIERLDFALKWESARLSYFESLGLKIKVKEQN